MRLQRPCRGLHSLGHLPWHTSLSSAPLLRINSLDPQSEQIIAQCFTLATDIFFQRVRFSTLVRLLAISMCTLARFTRFTAPDLQDFFGFRSHLVNPE